MDTPAFLTGGCGLEDEARPGVSLGSRHRDCTQYLSAMRNLVLLAYPSLALGLEKERGAKIRFRLSCLEGCWGLVHLFFPHGTLLVSFARRWFKDTANAGPGIPQHVTSSYRPRKSCQPSLSLIRSWFLRRRFSCPMFQCGSKRDMFPHSPFQQL